MSTPSQKPKAKKKKAAPKPDMPVPVAKPEEPVVAEAPQEEPSTSEPPVPAVPKKTGLKKKGKGKKKKKKVAADVEAAPRDSKLSKPVPQPKPSAAAPAPAASSADADADDAEPQADTENAATAYKIPNVRPKLDDLEQKKMEAMLGKLADNQSNALFIANEKDATKTFSTPADLSADIDLKTVPTVYLKNCNDGKYVIDRRTTKVLIEGCNNLHVSIHKNVLTNTLEVWKCKNLTLHIDHEIRTLQLDLLEDVKLTFTKRAHFHGIIWNQIENVDVQFLDAKKHNFKTGLKQMQAKYPDSMPVVDQFIIRWVNDRILEEQCIRLRNGHLSTEREAIDWDKRNEVAKQAYLQKVLKEAGVHLNRVEKDKILPNAPCPCNSGKKFKKCCQGLKKAEGTIQPVTYREGGRK